MVKKGLPDLSKISLPSIDKIEEVEEEKETLSDMFDWGYPTSTPTREINNYYNDGWIGNFHLDRVLSYATEAGASDIYINEGQSVGFKIKGEVIQYDFEFPTPFVTMELGKAIMSNLEYSIYVKDKNFDKSYTMVHGPYSNTRFRLSIGRSKGHEFFVFRRINDKIPTLSELEVEREIVDWMDNPDGLILICGSTGTGKSTTLASIIRDRQLKVPCKINTIEKPIEYLYPIDGLALITQREVGMDCTSFYTGLTACTRQNPDIILIGEVRDTEEVNELVRAAEMGHLTISTMHTNSVATTINRIQSLFSGNDRLRILNTLSDTMRGLANQVLVKDVDGEIFAVREILTVNNEIKTLILNGDTVGIRAYQMEHKITMEHKLIKAVKSGRCTFKEARKHSSYISDFDDIARQEGLIK